MAEMSDVDTALSFAAGACHDANWMAQRFSWSDAVQELREAKDFIDEALNAIEELRKQDREEW